MVKEGELPLAIYYNNMFIIHLLDMFEE